MSIVLTGNDTSIIDDRTLVDFAGAEPVVIDFENDISNTEAFKNNNAIITPNRMGTVATATFSFLIGSNDDKYFNSKRKTYLTDPAAYIMMNGSFTKRSGDGEGNISKKLITLNGGTVKKNPTFKENVQGDSSQAMVVYVVSFANSDIQDL